MEQWLVDPAMAVPYYPTINVEQNPADPIWMTADFGSSYREVLTFCDGDQYEEGEIEVVFFGRPGIGYTALITAAEAMAAVMMAQRDPADKLVLVSRSAPFEFTAGSAERSYSVSVFFEYQYYI